MQSQNSYLVWFNSETWNVELSDFAKKTNWGLIKTELSVFANELFHVCNVRRLRQWYSETERTADRPYSTKPCVTMYPRWKSGVTTHSKNWQICCSPWGWEALTSIKSSWWQQQILTATIDIVYSTVTMSNRSECSKTHLKRPHPYIPIPYQENTNRTCYDFQSFFIKKNKNKSCP